MSFERSVHQDICLNAPDPAAGATDAPRPEPSGAPAEEMVIRRQFRSADSATRAVLVEVTRHLAALGVEEDDLGNVELALAEALNNVTEHAYGPEGGMVTVTVRILAASIICEVCDRGQPMPRGQAPRTSLPLISPPDHLPEGGFGWHLIRCLVSDLCYRRDETENRLTFTLPRRTEDHA